MLKTLRECKTLLMAFGFVLCACICINLTSLMSPTAEAETDSSFLHASQAAAEYFNNAVHDPKGPYGIKEVMNNTPVISSVNGGARYSFAYCGDFLGATPANTANSAYKGATAYSWNDLSTLTLANFNASVSTFAGGPYQRYLDNTTGFASYAHFGYTLYLCGLDNVGLTDSPDSMRFVIGMVIMALYIGAIGVVSFFGMCIVILQYANPFRLFLWFNTQGVAGKNSIDFGLGNPIATSGSTARNAVKNGFAEIAKALSTFYTTIQDWSLVVLVPLFFAFALAGWLLFSKGRQFGHHFGKFFARVFFIILGVPMMLATYDAALEAMKNTLNASDSMPTRIIESTFCDFGSWALNSHLKLPYKFSTVSTESKADDGAVLGYDIENDTLPAVTKLNTRYLCLEINKYVYSGNTDVTSDINGKIPGIEFSALRSISALWETSSTPGYDEVSTERFSVYDAISLLRRYAQGETIKASAIESLYSNINATEKGRSSAELMAQMANTWNMFAVYKDEGGTYVQSELAHKFAYGDNSTPVDTTITVDDVVTMSTMRLAYDYWPSGLAGINYSTKTQDAGGSFNIWGNATNAQDYDTSPGYGHLSSHAVWFKASAVSTDKPLGLTPMAMYNYLNTKFEQGAMYVQNLAETDSEFVLWSHYAVNNVGYGLNRILYLVDTITILACLSVLGYVYALSMLVSNFKAIIKVIPNVFIGMFGFMKGIAATVAIVFAMICNVVFTVILYGLAMDIIVLLFSVLEPVLSAILNALSTIFGISTSTAAVLSEMLSPIAGLLTCFILLSVLKYLIRYRTAVVSATTEACTEAINKLFQTNVAAPNLQPNGNMLQNAAALAGGLALAATAADADGSMSSKLVDKDGQSLKDRAASMGESIGDGVAGLLGYDNLGGTKDETNDELSGGKSGLTKTDADNGLFAVKGADESALGENGANGENGENAEDGKNPEAPKLADGKPEDEKNKSSKLGQNKSNEDDKKFVGANGETSSATDKDSKSGKTADTKKSVTDANSTEGTSSDESTEAAEAGQTGSGSDNTGSESVMAEGTGEKSSKSTANRQKVTRQFKNKNGDDVVTVDEDGDGKVDSMKVNGKSVNPANADSAEYQPEGDVSETRENLGNESKDKAISDTSKYESDTVKSAGISSDKPATDKTYGGGSGSTGNAGTSTTSETKNSGSSSDGGSEVENVEYDAEERDSQYKTIDEKADDYVDDNMDDFEAELAQAQGKSSDKTVVATAKSGNSGKSGDSKSITQAPTDTSATGGQAVIREYDTKNGDHVKTVDSDGDGKIDTLEVNGEQRPVNEASQYQPDGEVTETRTDLAGASKSNKTDSARAERVEGQGETSNERVTREYTSKGHKIVAVDTDGDGQVDTMTVDGRPATESDMNRYSVPDANKPVTESRQKLDENGNVVTTDDNGQALSQRVTRSYKSGSHNIITVDEDGDGQVDTLLVDGKIQNPKDAGRYRPNMNSGVSETRQDISAAEAQQNSSKSGNQAVARTFKSTTGQTVTTIDTNGDGQPDEMFVDGNPVDANKASDFTAAGSITETRTQVRMSSAQSKSTANFNPRRNGSNKTATANVNGGANNDSYEFVGGEDDGTTPNVSVDGQNNSSATVTAVGRNSTGNRTTAYGTINRRPNTTSAQVGGAGSDDVQFVNEDGTDGATPNAPTKTGSSRSSATIAGVGSRQTVSGNVGSGNAYMPNGTAADAAYYGGQQRSSGQAAQSYTPNGTAADAAHYGAQARSSGQNIAGNDGSPSAPNVNGPQGYAPNGTSADTAYYEGQARSGRQTVSGGSANSSAPSMNGPQGYVPNGTAADAAYYGGQQRSGGQNVAGNTGSPSAPRTSGPQNYAPNGTAADTAYYTQGGTNGYAQPQAGSSNGPAAGSGSRTVGGGYVPNGTAADAAHYGAYAPSGSGNVGGGNSGSANVGSGNVGGSAPRQTSAQGYVPNGTAADAAYYEAQARNQSSGNAGGGSVNVGSSAPSGSNNARPSSGMSNTAAFAGGVVVGAMASGSSPAQAAATAGVVNNFVNSRSDVNNAQTVQSNNNSTNTSQNYQNNTNSSASAGNNGGSGNSSNTYNNYTNNSGSSNNGGNNGGNSTNTSTNNYNNYNGGGQAGSVGANYGNTAVGGQNGSASNVNVHVDASAAPAGQSDINVNISQAPAGGDRTVQSSTTQTTGGSGVGSSNNKETVVKETVVKESSTTINNGGAGTQSGPTTVNMGGVAGQTGVNYGGTSAGGRTDSPNISVNVPGGNNESKVFVNESGQTATPGGANGASTVNQQINNTQNVQQDVTVESFQNNTNEMFNQNNTESSTANSFMNNGSTHKSDNNEGSEGGDTIINMTSNKNDVLKDERNQKYINKESAEPKGKGTNQGGTK